MKTFFTILLLSLFSISLAQVRCGAKCRFRLCRANEFNSPLVQGSKFRPGSPVFPIHPFICNLDGTLSDVVKTGEPMIEFPRGVWIPLKTYTGATTAFPKKFFFGKKIPTLGKTGIVFKPPTGNQWSVIDGACIKVPVTRATEAGTPVDKKDRSSCVSFRMEAPKMQVTVFWNSADDVDLRVIQPNLDIVAFGSKTSIGVLRVNNNVDACGKVVVGKELAVFSAAPPGLYRAILKMKSKCSLPGRKKISYTIKVSVDGKDIKQCKGKSAAKNGDFVTCEYTIV